jgi:hypothetical protein
MSWLANPQFVTCGQQPVEVVLLCCDVGHRDDDVNNRFGSKTWNRSRSNVLDIDVHCRQRVKDPTPVMQVDLRPPGVIAAKADLERFWTTDDLDRRDVRPTRLAAVHHQHILYVLRQFTTSIDGAAVGGFVEPRRRHAGSEDRDLRRIESGDTFLLAPGKADITCSATCSAQAQLSLLSGMDCGARTNRLLRRARGLLAPRMSGCPSVITADTLSAPGLTMSASL